MHNYIEPEKLNKKTHTYALKIALISIILYNIIFSIIFYVQKENLIKINEYNQKSAVDITDLFISEKFDIAYDELNIVRNSNEMYDYVNAPLDTVKKNEVEKMFTRFIKNKNGLTQIRMLNTEGHEIIRVNKKDNETSIVKQSELQDKSDRYYFQHSLDIDKNQIYISDIDLNVENGKIVEPYEPTIRFVAKLVDENNQLVGMLVLNFDGEAFFSVIKKFEKLDFGNLEIGVLDLNNYWSLNRANVDLEEILLTVQSNQSDQMRTIFEKFQKNKKATSFGYFDNEGLNYYFKKIDEIEESKFVFEGKEFAWYFISYFDINKIIDAKHILLNNRYLIEISSSIIVFFSIYIITYLLRQKKNQDITILTSAYITENTNDGILVLNSLYEIVYCNRVFEDIYGYKLEEIKNTKVINIFEGKINKQKYSNENGRQWKENIWNKTKSGNWLLKNLTIKEIRDAKGKLIYYIGIYSAPLETNKMTNLSEDYNYYSSKMDQEDILKIGNVIDQMDKSSEKMMALTVQLRGEGQKLLESSQSIHGKFFGEGRLDVMLDPEYTLIALPKTELFIFVLPLNYDVLSRDEDNYLGNEKYHDKDEILVEKTIQHINRLLNKIQINLGYSTVEFKYQVGVSISDLKVESGSDLIKNSLIALEALNKYKKTSYLIYDETHYNFIKYENTLKSELRSAFDNNEFYMVYQPQYNVRTNKIIGFEALVRWENKTLGNVPPDKFIPILEETGDIFSLGKRVFDLVIANLKTFDWKDTPTRVSINLSSKEFTNKNVIKDLIEIINKNKINGVKFCFEITETTIVDNLEQANEIIALLHKENIEISIDDFGTGYSSLGYLKQLVTDELKIDRMFIMDYPHEDNGKIIKAIISMGAEIEMNIVVEGVETAEQLDLIKELKCDYYQGYYGSKPTQLENIHRMIVKSNQTDVDD